MSMEALARDFFDAIERGDLDRVRACYAPDAVIWHNDDGIETTREQNLALLAAFVTAFAMRRYERRRVIVFDGGFVQQHELRVGPDVVLPIAVVCRVADGRIVRLDEYLDSAQRAMLML